MAVQKTEKICGFITLLLPLLFGVFAYEIVQPYIIGGLIRF